MLKEKCSWSLKFEMKEAASVDLLDLCNVFLFSISEPVCDQLVLLRLRKKSGDISEICVS